MATTGAIFPASNTTASEAPWDDVGWANPGNIYSDNGSYASCYNAAAYNSAVLKAYNFNTFSGIPDNATILGVICRLNTWKSTSSDANLGLLQLLGTDLAKVGTNQCSSPVALSQTDTTIVTKGAGNDLWGNVLTPAWVKNSNFGVAIGMVTSGAGSHRVDYVTLEVYYAVPSGEFFVMFS